MIEGPDALQFGSLAVELGFATQAQVAEAVTLRTELEENGVTARVSDLLIDAGAITIQQCQQVELQQEMQLVLANLAEKAPPRSEGLWVVAALAPVVALASLQGVIACAVAVTVGAFVAERFPLRWIAIGWIASLAVPGASLPSIAAAGVLADKARQQLLTALVIAASAALVVLEISVTPGLLFMMAGLGLVIARLRK